MKNDDTDFEELHFKLVELRDLEISKPSYKQEIQESLKELKILMDLKENELEV